MTDTLIIRLVDRDVDGDDDIIATYFLKLSSISYSSQDDIGFDPTFGPCFINFSGAPREITENNEQFQYLNDGWVPGKYISVPQTLNSAVPISQMFILFAVFPSLCIFQIDPYCLIFYSYYKIIFSARRLLY